nr:zinc ribbon domain-containing protein [Ktedonobacter robiniae]
MEYKADWYGRDLVKIDKWYPSSKRCFECGHLLGSLALDVRQWTCPACAVQHDRDINAAKVRRFGACKDPLLKRERLRTRPLGQPTYLEGKPKEESSMLVKRV